MTLNFNPDNKKVIVSIDGGGMRGMIAIAMLAELEAMTGKRVQDLVHMIAGTSAGAIIAGGIAAGLSAQEILDDIYYKRLPGAFEPQNVFFWLRYVFGGLRYLYNSKPFDDALVPIVGKRKMKEIDAPILLITTKDVRSGETWYITNKGPGAPLFAEWPLAGAVAASSAAPIFFKPVAGNLIDGGAGMYGNPALAAAVEAMEYIGTAEGFYDGNVILISLGTGYLPNIVGDGKADRFNIFKWIPYLLVENIDDAALQQIYTVEAIYRSRIDARRYNPYLDRATVRDELGVALAEQVDPAGLSLDTTKPEQLKLMDALGRAYARKIDWTLPGLMPWKTPGGHPKPTPQAFTVDWSKTPYGR